MGLHFQPQASAVGLVTLGDTHLWQPLAGDLGAVLVTGDRRLLEKPYPGRLIITPRELWDEGLEGH